MWRAYPQILEPLPADPPSRFFGSAITPLPFPVQSALSGLAQSGSILVGALQQ
ncbi:MAG: hypothetical protein ACXWMY_14085 [Vulcanimicrobiaceae bacterium]